MRMSECFTEFRISGLGEPNIYQNLMRITRKWGIGSVDVSICLGGILGGYLFLVGDLFRV